jgi:integrase
MTVEYNVRRKRRKADTRPEKPYADFPLYAHPLGYWSKKVKRKIIHFGRWGRVVDGKLVKLPFEMCWQEALAAYKAHAEDAYAGRIREFVVQPDRPAQQNDSLTLAELCNRFLTAKLRQMEAGEIGRRMFDEYKSITDMLISRFGKERIVNDLAADDFEGLRSMMAERWGPVRLTNAITRTKSVFRYAYESGLVASPVRSGPQFKKPSASVLRRHRATNGKRLLTAAELQLMLDALDGIEVTIGTNKMITEPVKIQLERNTQLRAMVMLGLNAAFGNHDCATLPLSAIDLDKAMIDYPRPKSGIARRCPLWKETVEALRAAIEEPPRPNTDEAMGLVFITSRGRPWLSGGIANPISHAIRRVMKALKIHRPGIGPYTLRHVFRTVADGARDHPAIDLIMGHSDPSMAAHYREHIDDARLQVIVEHVRHWLFNLEETK